MPDRAASPRQLALDLALPPRLGAGELIVGAANAGAVAHLERWPDWPAPVALLVGPPAAGKSHLAALWAAAAGAGAPQLKALTPIAVAATAGAVALLAQGLPYKLGLMLAAFAGKIQAEVGNAGLVARMGGEEFAVVTPTLNARQARELAERPDYFQGK